MNKTKNSVNAIRSKFINYFNKNNHEAIEYLYKRGLNKNIIEEFKLGFVPWKNDFYQNLLKKYSEEDINSTGLYYKSDKTGKYVDRFNSRIIFPVNNLILFEKVSFHFFEY